LEKALHECHELIKDFKATTPQKEPKTAKNTSPQPEMLIAPPELPILPKNIKTLVQLAAPKVKLQAAMARIRAVINFREIYGRSTTPIHKIQLVAKTDRNTGLFLRSIPTESGFEFSNKVFKVTINRYLSTLAPHHLEVKSFSTKCICNPEHETGKTKSCDQEHMYNCKEEGNFTSRHNDMQHVIEDAINGTGLRAELEVAGNPRFNATTNRRGNAMRFDVSVIGLEEGCKKIHTDITIPSHTAKEHMSNAVGTPLYNADKAVTAKHSKYKDKYDRDTETFLPLAFESSGAMHRNVPKFMGLLSKRVNNRPPLEANHTTQTYKQYHLMKASCALWRSTSTGLLRVARASHKASRTTGMETDGQ
jgi:hypothetical protein